MWSALFLLVMSVFLHAAGGLILVILVIDSIINVVKHGFTLVTVLRCMVAIALLKLLSI